MVLRLMNPNPVQMASYYKTVRVLIQPRLYRAPIDEKYLGICIEACRGVCESYKELHYKLPVAFTSLSLQSVFLAGNQSNFPDLLESS